MANFVQYNLSYSGASAVAPVFPTPGVTYSTAIPPVASYTTTSGIGFTLPDDYNGAISLQVTSITNSPTIVVEVSNIDPQTYISGGQSTVITSAGPAGQQVYGATALFTDITADNVWVGLQMTNVSSNAAANTIVAVGLYACQSLAYRNVRVRISAGTNPAATVILGYGYLI